MDLSPLNTPAFGAAAPAEVPVFVPPAAASSDAGPAGSARSGAASGGGERRRALHVINGEHFAGAERVQDLLALRLPGHGFDVGFVALKAGRFGEARRSVATPLDELAMASRWDLRVAWAVAREYRAGGYDLLHAHTPRSALVAAIAARLNGAPLVYHVHSPTSRDSTHALRNWVNDRVERLAIRAASRLITVSPTLSEDLRSRGVPAERMTCVLNGVPGDEGAEPRRKPTGEWTLGMVALFRPRKGAEVLIESLASLVKRGHNVRLRMIGSFETLAYERQVHALASQRGVADRIDWSGFTTDVGAELARVDLLALPSLFGEGLPMVVLEAMAAGVPVVATRCEGVAQAVVDGATGRLVDPGKAESLAAAAASIIAGAYDYQQLSRASLARHAAEFSDDIMARRVAGVYRRVLGVPSIDAAS